MTSRNRFLNLIAVILMFFLSVKLAYAGAGMSEEQMEALMKNAEKMQEEIQALCKAGEKDKAQDRAMKFGREVAKSKAMKEMKKCGEMMQQPPGMAGIEDFSSNERHVCDSF